MKSVTVFCGLVGCGALALSVGCNHDVPVATGTPPSPTASSLPKVYSPSTVPTSVAPAGWKTFTSTDGHYSVAVPSLPLEDVGMTASLITYGFTLKTKLAGHGALFMLMSARYPVGHIAQVGAQKFIDNTHNKVYAKRQIRLTYKKVIKGKFDAGIEFQYPGGKDLLITSRTIVSGDDLYQFTALVNKNAQKDARKYLDSFRPLK